MKFLRDAAVLAGTAFLTALIASPVIGPGSARAQDEPVRLAGLVANPRLEIAGVTFALQPAKAAYAAKEKPVLVLTATAGKTAAEGEVTVRMHTTAPTSPMARMLVLPVEAFAKTIAVDLAAGATKTIRIETSVTLAAGSTFTIELASGKQRLASSAYAVPAPVVEIPTVILDVPEVKPESR